MLDHCLAVERERGREREERWAARTLDLDVLVAGDEHIDEPGLTVPHPRLAERRFVVEPLADVWRGALPDGRHPVELAEGLADQHVRRVAGPGWADPAPRRAAAVTASLAVGIAAIAWCRRRAR
jgi:2-amino-4-hydroxy-6-hydroxymethyldihydropteridine diphosphokinase